MSARVMELVTERSQIRTVAARWAEQYRHSKRPNHREIGERLAALDPETASADEVVSIIGNSSWTSAHCDACGESCGAFVTMGEEPDYESSTIHACEACLRRALALIEEHNRASTPSPLASGVV